jgi:DMSO/TMAO reductase YedYZ heme-binding membrane subunit
VTAQITTAPASHPASLRTQLDADARTDRMVRLGAVVALWLGLLLVTYWWDAGGGVTDLADWGSGLTSLGRLTGLWSANLLLVQVLLMSRLPPLEHAFGRDRLARIHRLIGFLSFDLMIAHIVMIIAGYASGQSTQVLATTWDLITAYGGVLLAVAGTICLIMVVVTSVKAARRRLRYESWHLLHLYAYLGVGLTLPHQLWTGQEFLQSPGATVYWWTLWAAAAASLIVWRILLPVGRSLRHSLRVISVVRESSDVVSTWRDGGWTGCRCEPGSSSTSGSSTGRDGPGPIRSRCPPHPTSTPCGSPPRRSARAVPGSPACDRAPGCSSRVRTDG